MYLGFTLRVTVIQSLGDYEPVYTDNVNEQNYTRMFEPRQCMNVRGLIKLPLRHYVRNPRCITNLI